MKTTPIKLKPLERNLIEETPIIKEVSHEKAQNMIEMDSKEKEKNEKF